MEIKENNLKELIEKYMSIEETEENHEELHQLGHEIDHVIFVNNFYLVTHNDGEEKEKKIKRTLYCPCSLCVIDRTIHL